MHIAEQALRVLRIFVRHIFWRQHAVIKYAVEGSHGLDWQVA